MNTYDKVKRVVVETFKCEEDEVTENVSFDELGADSLDKVELLMNLEEEFGVDIPDEEAEGIQTVDQTVKYIESKVASG